MYWHLFKPDWNSGLHKNCFVLDFDEAMLRIMCTEGHYIPEFRRITYLDINAKLLFVSEID